MVFHTAEKALLWGIVPVVSPSRHGLPQISVFSYFDESVACIVYTLVTVEHCPLGQRNSMILDELFYSFKDEIHLKGAAQHIGQNLFCVGIQDGR